MRKLKIFEHISLDGVIQVSGEDGDYPYGDWTAPYRSPAGRDAVLAAHDGSFDLLLASGSSQHFAGWFDDLSGAHKALRRMAAQRSRRAIRESWEGVRPR